ncbi:MAG TPA: response regulator transcription factor [Thermomicrobiales bacterium]|nr:response regulator transcription factor [Thermomicrobiales bacterium]
MTGASIGVLLIEDYGVIREGLKLLLARTPHLAVVGEAATGREGLELFARLAAAGGVDVVVTDLGLPDLDGLEVARRVKALRPAARVLFLTMHDDDAHVRGMLDVGADGYLLKDAAAGELVRAIEAVARGEVYLSPAVARRLMTQARQGREREHFAALLTEREREVLALLAGGASSKEIARALGLSVKTVENHRARVLAKLGVVNTAAAVARAHREGLLAAPPPAAEPPDAGPPDVGAETSA